jgi:hypothetical protein
MRVTKAGRGARAIRASAVYILSDAPIGLADALLNP